MKNAIIYSAAVCLFSWAVYYTVAALGSEALVSNPAFATVFKSLYMLFPMIVALAIQAIRKERPGSTGLLRFKWSWAWIVAILCPVAAVFVSIPLSALIPGVSLQYGADQLISMNGLEGAAADAVRAQVAAAPASAMISSTLLSGILAGCTINAIFAFGEEYGWRNYLVNALKGRKFIVAALFIGIVWGIWHAPLILAGHNYPQHPVPGLAMMCVFCILAGVIELYFTLKLRSVFVAAFIHGTINALAALTYFFVQGGNDLTVGLCGLAGFASLALVIAALRVYDRRSGENIMTSAILEEQ